MPDTRENRCAVVVRRAALVAMTLLVAACARDDAGAPVRSLDDPRLRDGGVPHAQQTALDFNMTPDQLRLLDPAYPVAGGMPLAIAGANRIGEDLVLLRLRGHREPRSASGDAPEWSYAVDCRSGEARLLGAGIGIGRGNPSSHVPADVPEPTEAERTPAFDLVCGHRTDCEFNQRGNRCEQAVERWIQAQDAASGRAEPAR